MSLDYQTIADWCKADDLIHKIRGKVREWSYRPIQEGPRSFRLANTVYSPQEILIKSRPDINDGWYPDNTLPAGIERTVTVSPRKEYISFVDAGGTKRYYLVPKEGIRLKKKGGSYKVVNPIPDYSIYVDRALAKKAREDAEELIDYVTTLWNVLIEPPDHRPHSVPDIDEMPSADNKEAWFDFLVGAKYPRDGYSWALSTLTQKIRDKCTRDALAYAVTPVPDTRMDHTAHWGMLDALRAAGRLEQYEGKRKEKRKDRKDRR